jgi:hypothetical protein
MFGKRLGIGTGVATVLAASVVAIGAGSVIAGSAEPPAWQKGLQARSEALNQKFGLGDYRNVTLSTSGAPSASDPDWLRALELRSEAMNRRYGLGSAGDKVTVRFVARTSNGDDISDGGVAGTSDFKVSGAIADTGKAVVYRTRKDAQIMLRFASAGKKGAITFVVRIDAKRGTSRWTIASGTKAYAGLHGTGTERENADYTVSTLTGTVSR